MPLFVDVERRAFGRSAVAGAATLVAFAAIASCGLFPSVDGFVGAIAGDGGTADATQALPAADAATDAKAIDAGQASAYATVVLSDGPLAYWRLGEAVGPAAKDETSRFPATYLGGVVLGVAGALTGESDTAAAFKGGNYVSVPSPASFDFAGKATYSIEAWVKRTRDGGILGKGTYADDAGYTGWFMAYRDNGPGDLELEFWRGSASRVGARVVDNKFYHVVVTFDGFTSLLFLDGTQASANVVTENLVGTQSPLNLGVIEKRGAFEGVLDEVAVYDKALAPARVKAHFNAAQIP